MTVRFAAEVDIPSLLRLLEQVNLVHHRGRPDLFRRATKYGEAELKAILKNAETPVLVAVDAEGRVLGHAFCVLETVENDRLLCDRKTLYIDDICVDACARERGVGRALYEAALALARERGCYNVTLNVWTCNSDALAFYGRMGLKPQKIGMERVL